jgi:hypothetical protein
MQLRGLDAARECLEPRSPSPITRFTMTRTELGFRVDAPSYTR